MNLTLRPFAVQLGEGIDPALAHYAQVAFARLPEADAPTHLRVITDHDPANPRPIRARVLLPRQGSATAVAASPREAVDELVDRLLASAGAS
ncbi:MAG: hypothetical protein J0I34_18765 [Pseudonocardia sp.]|uniref:hypothetical protein n=1 Tax=unclassified Pseudonocardia TaxID=2619320 RepID=UPI00086B5D38|nr:MULTISPECIES: hypothetical protein [unclassified Pseudonocardia]MBN9110809.1 hypothetical protein [Pseudonocardia sp.]ODU26882.1 MAG: hypothetical protein ABS80_05930 [Pseudonocardia sp. SCN 72-51]ODV05395.1 MAG: hypothetical protein ABT15_17045 [Pseudonocardia sp. SCN 73-27]RTL69555.1 MAG: hypothetical protein EKK42_05400 [Pseudonocardiaceae bacterium]